MKGKQTRIVCQLCGKVFYGGTDRIYCPSCSSEKKKCVIRKRICIECGKTFDGGPRAKRCPSCRIEQAKRNKAKYQRQGAERSLGSVDKCQLCGKEYVVTSGRQKYCSKECMDIAVKSWQREHKKANADVEKTHEMHRKTREKRKKVCMYCGKIIIGNGAKFCSDYCSSEQRKIQSCLNAINRKEKELQILYDAREVYRKEVVGSGN